MTLFERAEFGGSLNRIGRADFKADLLRYRDYLVHRAGSLGDVRLRAATTDELGELDPDVVVLATGSTVRGGEDGRAVDLAAALADPSSVGEHVVVDGGGQFAVETAWFLAGQGRRATVAPGEASSPTTSGLITRSRCSPSSPGSGSSNGSNASTFQSPTAAAG